MNLIEKAQKILQQPVCDHCLGRQFAQLLHGYSNDERGHFVRTIVAMSIDKSKEEKKEGKAENETESNVNANEKNEKPAFISIPALDMSNFAGFKFHNLEVDKKIKPKKCSVCNGLFLSLDKWLDRIEKAAKKYSFKTFLVGTKLSSELVEAEEALWERAGIDYCEPLKAEINREVGKLIEKRLKLRFDSTPDVNIVLNIDASKVDIEINPIFVYGEYQKLVRGIPQTKWPSGKYKTSVEQIIAKPFMRATNAKAHKLHALGREDIDARCLGWRPFVLELLEPETRELNFSRLAKKIERSVRVRKLRPSSIAEVRKIKEAKADKTYSMIVECSRDITRHDLKRLKSLLHIRQKTPQRVLHRRADKYRNRKIKYIKTKLINKRKFLLTIQCEAGLYVKELVSGDDGRTQPSVSQLLNADCRCKQLDVIKIHAKF